MVMVMAGGHAVLVVCNCLYTAMLEGIGTDSWCSFLVGREPRCSGLAAPLVSLTSTSLYSSFVLDPVGLVRVYGFVLRLLCS